MPEGNYRTAIRKKSGTIVAPSNPQTSLHLTRTVQEKRKQKAPHLDIIVQVRIGGQWEAYE